MGSVMKRVYHYSVWEGNLQSASLQEGTRHGMEPSCCLPQQASHAGNVCGNPGMYSQASRPSVTMRVSRSCWDGASQSLSQDHRDSERRPGHHRLRPAVQPQADCYTDLSKTNQIIQQTQGVPDPSSYKTHKVDGFLLCLPFYFFLAHSGFFTAS